MVLLQYSNYKRGSVLRTLVPLEGMNNISTRAEQNVRGICL